MRQALFFKRLAGSYDQLVQYVRAARPDMENVDDRPVPDATPAPSMNQVRKRSSSYSGQSSTSEIAPGLDLQAASDKASRRTHVRSASASVPGVLFQQAGSVNLVTRPGLRPSRSEDQIPASAKKNQDKTSPPSPEHRKRGLLRRMQRTSSEPVEQFPLSPDGTANSGSKSVPGQVAMKILEIIPDEELRAIRKRLAGFRREQDESAVAPRRKNHRLRNFLAGELSALRDARISAAIDAVLFGEALHAELDILRGEIEKRGRFASVDRVIDTGDAAIADEIDRLYLHHFFTKRIDMPALPASLQAFSEVVPPLFIASFGEAPCTLQHGDGRIEVLAMPDEIANDAAMQSEWKRGALKSLAAFVGRSADGLLLWTVAEHLGPAFHQFVTDLLFNRLRKGGRPESELRRYDGQPVRPLDKVRIEYRLRHAAGGSMSIDYTAVISPKYRGTILPQAETLTEPIRRYRADASASLQIDAHVTVKSSRDVEISAIRVRADGWNGG